MARIQQNIVPFLWFDDQAEAAANCYTSIFENGRVGDVLRYEEVSAQASGRAAGSVMTVAFELAGRQFVALNGGPRFRFNEAMSFVVNGESQAEVNFYWDKLSEGATNRPSSAAGSGTGSGCSGRWCRRCCTSCRAIRTRTKGAG